MVSREAGHRDHDGCSARGSRLRGQPRGRTAARRGAGADDRLLGGQHVPLARRIHSRVLVRPRGCGQGADRARQHLLAQGRRLKPAGEPDESGRPRLRLLTARRCRARRGRPPHAGSDHGLRRPHVGGGQEPPFERTPGHLEARSACPGAVRAGAREALFGQLPRASAGEPVRGLERAQPLRQPDPAVGRKEADEPGPLPQPAERLLPRGEERRAGGHRDRRCHRALRRPTLPPARPEAPADAPARLPAPDVLPQPQPGRAACHAKLIWTCSPTTRSTP